MDPALRLRRLPRDFGIRRRRPHRHRTDLRRQQADRAAGLRAVHRNFAARRQGSEPITDPEDLARLPEGPAKDPGTTTKDSSSTNWRSRTSTTRARSSRRQKFFACRIFISPRPEIQDLTTFLLGSEESSLPPGYQYKPGDSRRDIQEGWWIVRKYNCVGCHQFTPDQSTSLMGMKRYQDIQEQLPPKLLTEGARVDPEWLRKFLSNPALSTTDTNRNGVRPYLQYACPRFHSPIMSCASWCDSSRRSRSSRCRIFRNKCRR